MDGRPVNSSVDVMTALSDRRSGETVEVLLRGTQQITRPFQVAVTALPISQRIAYFVLFMFAEIITPVSDPLVAPLTVMIPLSVLYELSIWLGRGVERRLHREDTGRRRHLAATAS